MAATRVEARLFASLGLHEINPVCFESCRSIPYGGVMLLLPFLLECGLLSYQNHYHQRTGGYYNFDCLFILLAFMYLCRIKSLEQSKHLNPGDFGKLIGYDRIPEVKKLRGLVYEVTCQKHCDQWMADLAEQWITSEEPELYYVDGHVQVYHGSLATLGKKHVSRQRLCLPGMMEFWVNSSTGTPFFFITAQVNEKMLEMLESEIIPQLVILHHLSDRQQELMDTNPDYPLFTLVFDREAYSPAFFKRLWDKHRIAVITYRKNVKDKWDESLFKEMEVETGMGDVRMKLCEEKTIIDGCPLREVRKLSDDNHQTSIITTNKIITIMMIASYMFGRWVQENFFRYMRQEFAIDKIIQYGIEQIDDNFKVVNREYSNISYRIKKEREKLNRRKANLYNHQQQIPDQSDNKSKHEEKPDKQQPMSEQQDKQSKKMAGWFQEQTILMQQINDVEQQIEKLLQERSGIPYKIKVSQMPPESRYSKLEQESKHLQNILKMICYRAETALVNLLTPHYARSRDEIRALAKSIIMKHIDLNPDYQNNVLEVTLYPLANKRSNDAVGNIIDALNKTQTKYPGTELILFYKSAT